MDSLEWSELIGKMTDAGYGDLAEALSDGHGDCYTKNGRLNKSSLCRRLGWKAKQLEQALLTCRDLLSRDFGPPEN